ncbi:MAG: GAF domain-containing protein, partial [Nitrospirae bacterium]|nr:GAF domain-containing protein [Nitrospirota bacterium]
MARPRRTNGRQSGRRVQAAASGPRALPSKTRSRASTAASVLPRALSPKLQLHLLEMITASADSGRTPEDVAQICLRVFLELTEARGAAVYLQDEQTREMRCLAVSGDPVGQASGDWDQIVTRVVQSGRLVATADIHACPLKRGKVVEGVLVAEGLSDKKRDAGGVMGLLDFVAARLAVGLDHSRLAQKYAQKIMRIQQLEEVSEVLNASLDAQETLRRAIEGAVRLVDAEAGSLLLLNEQNNDLAFEAAVGEKSALLKEVRLKGGHGVAGLVARTGKPLIVNDAQHDPRVARDVDQLTGFSTRNILSVPVRTRNKTLGVLEAVNKRGGRPFSNWDLVEFASLSNQVAIALENARLFRDYQGKIKRLQKLQEISEVLNSTLNQAEIRKRAIKAATDLMDAEAGSLLLLDEAAGELYFEVALGEKGEGVREIRLKLGQGIAGHVAQTGEPVIINDVQNDPRFARQADKKSGFVTRNMVCVPVKARDKLLGVLQAINKNNGGLFGTEDLQD